MSTLEEKIRISNKLLRCCLSEFFGTYLLIFFAESVICGYNLLPDKFVDGNARLFAITFYVGIGAFIALTASYNVSGGHINPAITVVVATAGHFPWAHVPHYMISQYLGGFAAAGTTYLVYHEAIDVKHDNLSVALR